MRCPTYDRLFGEYCKAHYWEKDELFERIHNHRIGCNICQGEMKWAATCPPNPDLTIEQLQAAEVEATR